MFIVAFDPATDFTLRPWLARHWGGELGVGEVVGGSQVFLPNEKANILVYGSPVQLKGNLAPSGTGLDQTLFMTFATAQELARQSKTRAERELVVPTNQISAILVKLQPGVAPKNMVARIGREVPGVTALQSPELFRGTQRGLSGLLRILFVVLALVWVLSVAVTGLIFSLAAHERRRELGVLRALGAPRSVVFRLLLTEAVVLALAGAGSGIALCLAIAFWFREAIVFLLKMPFLFPPPSVLAALVAGGLLVALISVVLAALVPVWRISRMEPALAMRE
jgi:putative ABC transport system permease protein